MPVHSKGPNGTNGGPRHKVPPYLVVLRSLNLGSLLTLLQSSWIVCARLHVVHSENGHRNKRQRTVGKQKKHARSQYTASKYVLLKSSIEAWLFVERVRGRVVKAPAKAKGEEQATLGRVHFQDAGGTLRSCGFAYDQARPFCNSGLSLSLFEIVSLCDSGLFSPYFVTLLLPIGC